MTIGIARKFGRRVLLATDTMISDASIGRANAIPGRLKGIVLSPTVSVAYAGHADPALFAIRKSRTKLLQSEDPDAVAEILKDACASGEADLEFILVFHILGKPFLHKITSRGISGDLESCFIGDSAVVHQVRNLEEHQPALSHPDIGLDEAEAKFSSAFSALFREQGIEVLEGVGGFPIKLLASPYGHTYLGEALSMSWDRISLPRGITPAQHRAQRAGETAWSYNLISGSLRGVAILGAVLPQAGLGFIYAPLYADEPERIQSDVLPGATFIDSRSLLEHVQARVNDMSEADGSGVDELQPPD